MDAHEGRHRGVQGVDPLMGRAARMGLPPFEADLLGGKAHAAAPQEEPALRRRRVGVDHHRHIDVVKGPEPDELLLAGEVADLPLLPQPAAELHLGEFLGRDGEEGDIPVELRDHAALHKPDGRPQQVGELDVVPAGVGRAGRLVGVGMGGADDRVELPDDGDGAAGGPPLRVRAQPGAGKPVPAGEAERLQPLPHVPAGAEFLVSELRGGGDVPHRLI